MRKAENAGSGDSIVVTVSRLGSEPVNVKLPNDDTATVAAALDKAGVPVPPNAELFVSGEPAESEDILENGDILIISTNKQAGRA